MKTVIIAAALMFNVAAHADGFAPWAERAAIHDIPDAVQIHTPNSGFSPWKSEHPATPNRPSVEPRATANTGSVFSPWS